MSAHPGNKYAEKWSYEKTMDRLCAIEHSSHNDAMLYLNMALDHCGLYDDVWRYWRKKWKRNPEILQMMKMIMQRFEVRLFNKMAKKEIPERVAMFALKHHYGWGKEPDPDVEQPTDQYDYVDYQLIEEPKREYAPEPEQISEPATVKSVPMNKAEKAQIPPRMLTGYMIGRYNAVNPQSPILPPATYFNGPPPANMPAIPFEDGYFLTAA